MNTSNQIALEDLAVRHEMRDANIQQTRTAIELQDYRSKTSAGRCRDYLTRGVVICAAVYLVIEVVNAFSTGAIQGAVQ